MMTRCLDRRWTATQKHIDWKTKKREKIATACVKSMQISLNEQWPLNLNISMTIHIYRIVSWNVLGLSLCTMIGYTSNHRTGKHTHTERERKRKKCAHFKSAQNRTHARIQPHAHDKNMEKWNERSNERTYKNNINSKKRRCFAVWSNRSIIFMFPLCVHDMENGMHHESQFKHSTVNKTKQRNGKEMKSKNLTFNIMKYRNSMESIMRYTSLLASMWAVLCVCVSIHVRKFNEHMFGIGERVSKDVLTRDECSS